MTWEVNITNEFASWYGSLAESIRDGVTASVEMLEEDGPDLGRPNVDRITGSKFHNMKELRPRGPAKNCRVLFMFDPRRQAILLIGGDKSGQWSQWYDKTIPEAEVLYDTYLIELTNEGLLDS